MDPFFFLYNREHWQQDSNPVAFCFKGISLLILEGKKQYDVNGPYRARLASLRLIIIFFIFSGIFLGHKYAYLNRSIFYFVLSYFYFVSPAVCRDYTVLIKFNNNFVFSMLLNSLQWQQKATTIFSYNYDCVKDNKRFRALCQEN